MSLIIATGSNIGDRTFHLETALKKLSDEFDFIAQSRIYSSPAVDYEAQPDFYNQVLEFKIPKCTPEQVIKKILDIEIEMGRRRDIPKGPRTIDIDIIFWENEYIDVPGLKIPHPSWNKRSFVTLPLAELPYYETLKKSFIIPTTFDNCAEPI